MLLAIDDQGRLDQYCRGPGWFCVVLSPQDSQ